MTKLREKIGTLKSLTRYLIFSFCIIILYTICEFITSLLTGISHETLTTCLYGFFGTEIALCGFIKIFKIKKEDI